MKKVSKHNIKSKFTYVAAIFATNILLILSSCDSASVTSGDEELKTEPLQEETAEAEMVQEEKTEDISVEEEQEPTVEVTEEELQEFTELFNTDEYNGFLTESYYSPADINWDTILEFGAGIIAPSVSDEEQADYLEFIGEKKLYGDLFVARKSDLAEYIRKHTGLDDLSEDVLSWNYIPKYETFYKEHWSAYQTKYTCVSGEKTGENYELRFRVDSEGLPGSNAGKNYGRWADRVLTLTKTNSELYIESNSIQWDDYCDEEQTFDIELPQFDGPIHFATYTANPDEADISIVKDGNLLTDLYTSIYTDNGNGYLKKILAVGFFDFDGDGMKDVAVIGDSDLGRYALLYEAVPTESAFEPFMDLDEVKVAEIGSDFTIAGIKKALIGDNQEGVYGTYQELYSQIARIYNIADEKNEYDLVYTDDDDIPELVVGYPGYWVSLIAYENGKAHYLMNKWPYGAGGNGGYSYVPSKGIYYNGNADHAGAIYYDTYMSKRDVGELGTDYWVKNTNFNDIDGDGCPSDDELEASGEYVGSSEYHSEIDRNMTEDEIKAVVDLYESYEMKYLSGKMDYSTFLEKLAGKEVGITEEQALAAIKKYCIEGNPDLENIVNAGEYTVYWNVETVDDDEIVVLYRSYTGAQLRYHIDRFSGSTYSKEFVPGITDEEQWTDEYFNAKDYID